MYQFVWVKHGENNFEGGLTPCTRSLDDDYIPYYVATNENQTAVVEAAIESVPFRSQWPKFIPVSCLTRTKLNRMSKEKLEWLVFVVSGLDTGTDTNANLVEILREHIENEMTVDFPSETDDDGSDNAPVWILEQSECGDDKWEDIETQTEHAKKFF